MEPAAPSSAMIRTREPKTAQRGLAPAMLAGMLLAVASARASDIDVNLDLIGVTVLRATTTNLNGSGVTVGQPEGVVDTNQPPTFEVDPSAVGIGGGLISYLSSNGISPVFPNTVGGPSYHADAVAANFYGQPGGVATNVVHVDNYDADYFLNAIMVTFQNTADQVVNQSFIVYPFDIPTQEFVDSVYDDYALNFNTLFVSGAGNAGGVPVSPPSTCYNGICVGAVLNLTNYSSVGPTLDNGRAKPDITAPNMYTSFSTPQVAGAAAILIQAGLRGDGGGDTRAATDICSLKALLLNGAIKPADWTNVAPSPLDWRYGTGVLNVFNSYGQLAGGKHPFVNVTSVAAGQPHPPALPAGNIAAWSGWDLNTISSGAGVDTVNHYYFDLTNTQPTAPFTATATLTWNRQAGQTNINHLNLFLYAINTTNLVATSTSAVDNVQHLFIPQLPPGRYDLQVLKQGDDSVSMAETYAVAFEFFSEALRLTASGANAVFTWPVYPDGFVLETTTNLQAPASWTTVLTAPTIANGLNTVTVSRSAGNQYFRLRRP